MTAELPWQGCCWRLPVSAGLFRRHCASHLPVSASACCSCAAPTSWWYQSKSARKPKERAKALRWRIRSRKTWSSKSKIPPKVESKQVVLVKDQSKRGTMETQSTNQSPKCVTRQEAFVEVGFQRNCRIGVDCKCQDHNSIIKKKNLENLTFFFFFCKIGCSRRIFKFFLELVSMNRNFPPKLNRSR